jgi:protein gp37
MAANSKIEWCDHTFNPWIGCSKVSAACDHCYAERMGKRMRVEWGLWSERRKTKTWRDPVRWHNAAKRREAEGWTYRPRVFCGSLCDIFEANPQLDPWRVELWKLIEHTDRLTWLLLTKRPMNVLDSVPPAWRDDWPAHVWVGTTIETQPLAEQRLRYLCTIPAPVRFVSCEPLLGPLLLQDVQVTPYTYVNALKGTCRNREGAMEVVQSIEYHPINWVIVGGESGPKARPMHPDWVRRIAGDCADAQVPFFFKQWGAWAPASNWEDVPDEDAPRDTGSTLMFKHPIHEEGIATEMRRVGKKNAGKLLDGKEWTASPQVNP